MTGTREMEDELRLKPSPWVERWARQIPAGGTALDLAAGGGRHTRLLLALGYKAVAVDIDVRGLAQVRGRAEIIAADLERGPWPLAGRRFDGIVVTNYLWRPLFPLLARAMKPGCLLIYETFAEGNERFGKPSNPEFLLKPGELKAFAAQNDMTVLAYEHGEETGARPAMRQRIAAVRRDRG